MNIAICEDNAADCGSVIDLIKKYCRKNAYMCSIDVFKSGEEFLDAYTDGNYQLVLLDIYLPGLSGMDTARRLRKLGQQCSVIFITVSTDHALEGFGVSAVSYLVKPVTYHDMARALAMCRHQFEMSSRVMEVAVAKDKIPVLVNKIRYIEVLDKKVTIHMEDGDLSTRTTISDIEQRLIGAPFLRCHKSFIVNLRQVERPCGNDLLMRDGTRIPIRKNDRRRVLLKLMRFLSGYTEED